MTAKKERENKRRRETVKRTVYQKMIPDGPTSTALGTPGHHTIIRDSWVEGMVSTAKSTEEKGVI